MESLKQNRCFNKNWSLYILYIAPPLLSILTPHTTLYRAFMRFIVNFGKEIEIMEQYKVVNPIMIRTPMGHITKFESVFSDSNVSNIIRKISADQVFLNALKLSNPAFFDYIQHCINAGTAYSKKALHSMIKFYSRFTTRPTPFGGYASISLANWNHNTEFILGTSANGILQPDTQWLYKVVNILESEPTILYQLDVQKNKNIYIRSNRYVNPYISNCGTSAKQSANFTIRRTSLVDQVLSYAQNGVSFRELITYVASETNASTDIILPYIQQLLQTEFLITNLRVVSTTEDPLIYIIELLDQMKLDSVYNEFRCKLHLIHEKLAVPVDIQSSDFPNYISDIIDIMSSIAKSENYIYSYYRSESRNCHVGYNIRRELNQLNKLFSNFTALDTETDLARDFKRFFIEKHGPYCSIPLTTLLEQYEYHGLASSLPSRSEYLNNLILDTIKQNKREIVLSDFDIKQMAPKGHTRLPLSPSFEICCSVNSESYKSLNDGQFEILIGANIGANKLNCHFSRFNRSYNQHEKEEIYNNYRLLEHAIAESYKTINIFELPQNTRIQNICYSLPFYESLDFSLYSDSNISINDIYVRYSKTCERLYFFSKKHNSVIKFISDSMLNPSVSNYVSRLLKDVSAAMEFHYINALALFRTSNLKYIPKIRYSRIVLMPETWKLSKYDFNISSIRTFKSDLLRYMDKWKIPSWVFLSDRDNRILMDLNNELFIDLLFTEIKKRGIVTLTNEFSNMPWLKNEDSHHYTNEFIFSFIHEQPIQKKYFPAKVDNDCNEHKVQAPSSSAWLYYKIYINSNNANEFFKRHMPIFKSISSKYNIQLFFIRYSDPGFHIRIRFNCENKHIKQILQKEIEDYMLPLIKSGFCSDMVLSTYEREIERYGNIYTIQYAERYFCKDSTYCIDLLQKDETDIFKTCIRDALIIMETFYPDASVLYAIIEKQINVKDFSKEFYANASLYLNLHKFEMKLVPWVEILDHYYKEILDNSLNLYNTLEDIMFSLIHMHCNRLSGKQEFEQAVLSAAKLIIKNKVYRQRKPY